MVKIIEQKFKVNKTFTKKEIPGFGFMNLPDSEYRKKIDLIKTKINKNAIETYNKCFIINETSLEDIPFIIDFFDSINNDVIVVYFNKSGINVVINDIKHIKVSDVESIVKSYLTVGFEELKTNQIVKMVNTGKEEEFVEELG